MSVVEVSIRPAAYSTAERGSSSERSTRVETTTDADLICFSSVSGNTARFVDKVDARRGARSARIPLHPADGPLKATAPYVLVLPTYGGGEGHGAVPKQVIRFLNDPDNRALIEASSSGATPTSVRPTDSPAT